MSASSVAEGCIVATYVAPEGVRALAGAGRLFAVLDSCDAPQVHARVDALGPEAAPSLYQGRAAGELWNVAPHLVKVGEALLGWIEGALVGEPWGVFVVGDLELGALRAHLRTLLVVRTEEGEHLYFRYYDPRVLQLFLPTCLPGEVREFFGPVEAFGIPAPDSVGATFLRAAPELPEGGGRTPGLTRQIRAPLRSSPRPPS
jgi:hypothetical protein